MATFSNKVAIAVCDRCNFKYKNSELRADGNSPGLRVCEECWDPKDPWRLPPVKPDALSLKYPRPDTDIGLQGTHTIKWNTPGLQWNQPGIKWNQQVADTGEGIYD